MYQWRKALRRNMAVNCAQQCMPNHHMIPGICHAHHKLYSGRQDTGTLMIPVATSARHDDVLACLQKSTCLLSHDLTYSQTLH